MRRLMCLAVGLALLPALAMSAPAALADSGGLSVSPAILDVKAATGPISTPETIKNTTTGPLAITVSVHPWIQFQTGAVQADPKHTLAANITLSATSFTLAAGTSQTVTLTVVSLPAGGSLFGNLDVVGLPPGKPKRNGITVAYRLISTVRLEPASPVHSVQLATPKVSGKGATAALGILVRNAGNTVDPILGTAVVSGPGGTKSFAITGIRILPGGIVNVKLASLAGRKPGSYSVAVTLTQGTVTTPIAKRTYPFKILKPAPVVKPKPKPKKGATRRS